MEDPGELRVYKKRLSALGTVCKRPRVGRKREGPGQRCVCKVRSAVGVGTIVMWGTGNNQRRVTPPRLTSRRRRKGGRRDDESSKASDDNEISGTWAIKMGSGAAETRSTEKRYTGADRSREIIRKQMGKYQLRRGVRYRERQSNCRLAHSCI